MILEVTGCLFVVYEFMDGGVVTTKFTVGVVACLHLAEVHRLGIEGEQLVGEQFAHTSDVLQSLSCLNGAQHTSDGTQHASL